MNKTLHALVYLFLALAAAALVFEWQLNAKRAQLTARNKMQEKYLISLAKTIECESVPAATTELKKDVSPVEARIVDSPEQENVLEGHPFHMEQSENIKTFSWDNESIKNQLRMVWRTEDGTLNGKPELDGNEPIDDGPGTEQELLKKLFAAATDQQARLNSTRAELAKMRGRLEETVAEINALKPEARQDKVTIEEKKELVAKLEGEKATLEDQITKLKAETEELNGEITSLKDEVATTRDELEGQKEEVAKREKTIEQLKKMIVELSQTQAGKSVSVGAVASLTAGSKGVIAQADNELMFAVVRFDAAAMREIKGGNPDAPIPSIDLGVRRAGFSGDAGEFVGRVRLRQEIKGKSLVICDILESWSQSPLQANDCVFAD